MVTQKEFFMDGRCTCGEVSFRLSRKPMIVHCCHCTWCQRESGASFALNAMIEADKLELLSGQPEVVMTPTESGKGQKISRCPTCKIAVWSNYAGAGDAIHFVRVGTLDEAWRLGPYVHIYTESKHPWVALPPGAHAFDQYYDRKKVWPEESLVRRREALDK